MILEVPGADDHRHGAGGEQVLEIGTGYGYQCALLARLAAQVVSIEIWPGLAAQARRKLAAQAITNVRVVRHPHAAVESARPCARSPLS